MQRDEYASAVRIEPLPERLYDAAVRLWQDSGLTRPWNDPEADLRLAVGGSSSCVLAAIGDNDGLLATAMVGHDGHRGWFYYLGVDPPSQGRGFGRAMTKAAEAWLLERGIAKCHSRQVLQIDRAVIGNERRRWHPVNPIQMKRHGPRVPVLTFAIRCGWLVCECQNQKDTSKYGFLVEWICHSLSEPAADG